MRSCLYLHHKSVLPPRPPLPNARTQKLPQRSTRCCLREEAKAGPHIYSVATREVTLVSR